MNYQDDIKQAINTLYNGGLILYPTDTIWGIGCDATNEKAIEKIYRLKQRSDKKSMLVLIENEIRLEQYLHSVPEIAWDLLEVADKPLTIIYSGAKNLPPNLISEDGSIGIRIVKDLFCEDLIRRFKKPIVSTSANLSGMKSPMTFSDIDQVIIDGVDYVVRHKQNDITSGKPSGIIKLGEHGEVEVIRE